MIKPRNFGDTVKAQDAMYFMDNNSLLPPEVEVGYIPEYMRHSASFPHRMNNIVGFNPRTLTPGMVFKNGPLHHPRTFITPRDPRTFNTLMM